MHREIQIKQFPIVTTHWWPKTRNERFVWENEQYLYRFLPLVHNHVQVIWVRTRIRCVTCARALAHAAFTRGVGVNAWRRACLKRGADAPSYLQQPITYFSGVAWTGLGICMRRSDWLTPPLALEKLRQHHASDTPSVKRWRRHPVWMHCEPERAHTHVTHRMRVRTQITWTWLCTRGKKRYTYCSFSHTNRSFRVLGHQCVVTMGNCLIWISLHFLFPSYRDGDLYLPLYDWQTRTVWPKNIKIGSTEEKDTYILDALGVSCRVVTIP